MKGLVIMVCFLFCTGCLKAQDAETDIYRGNQAYRSQAYEDAIQYYKAALEKSPKNLTAKFNLGNALFRLQRYDEAGRVLEEIDFPASGDAKIAASAAYNRGVALTSQKKLDESIEAYKQALRLNPNDTQARENLQRALNEKKQQKNQQQKKKQEQQKLTKQQIQQMLKALEEQEKNLQQKMQKSRVPAPGQQEKDW